MNAESLSQVEEIEPEITDFIQRLKGVELPVSENGIDFKAKVNFSKMLEPNQRVMSMLQRALEQSHAEPSLSLEACVANQLAFENRRTNAGLGRRSDLRAELMAEFPGIDLPATTGMNAVDIDEHYIDRTTLDFLNKAVSNLEARTTDEEHEATVSTLPIEVGPYAVAAAHRALETRRAA